MHVEEAENLFVGLMSGTSLDGVDAVVIALEDSEIQCHGSIFVPFSNDLRSSLKSLASASTWVADELFATEYRLTEFYAEVVASLLKQVNLSSHQIKAIGCHGQTVRHIPDLSTPYTVQIVNGALLAELSGATVVCDFRSRDMAAGGQGAPLAPGFHYHVLRHQYPTCGVINIGGIGNITYWDDQQIIGFDTGPGNILLDHWVQTHFDRDFDANGELAGKGQPIADLLDKMLQDHYFQKSYPKSTGREYFNAEWLNSFADIYGNQPPIDVLSTLAELSAKTIADQLNRTGCEQAFVCGGGVHNRYLMQRLKEMCTDKIITSSQEAGIDPDFMEATAFAWFASQTINGKPANVPAVTDAKGERILGAIYPA